MADTVLFNGIVIPLSRIGARATAVLVRDGKIVAVGSDQKILGTARTDARRIDLSGRTVIPGFNDNHIHVAAMGNHFTTPNLHGMTKSEIITYLLECYADPKPSDMIVGVQWDYTHCPDPHREDLDRAFGSTPVVLTQYSGHAVWANSAALNLVGISEATPDWPSGGAERDESGRLTGIVREPYGHGKYRKLFRRRQFDPERIMAGIPAALKVLSSYGFTSVQDNTWAMAGLKAYRELRSSEKLNMRVSCWSLGDLSRPLRYQFEHAKFDPDWYHLGPRKFFLDGAFSSRTAYLMDPYEDNPGTIGKGMSMEEIRHLMVPAARTGRQIACHSIGDRATMQFCDGVEEVSRKHPRVREMRWRVEHGQIIRHEDIERMARLGVVVSAQAHALTDPQKDRRLLGVERARGAYPYRSLLDAGVPLAFGSDFPGEGTYDPLLGVHLVVNREGPEAISAEEALFCYTAGSAHAEFREDRKGTIEAGKLADLTILSDDPTSVDPERIRDITVEMTIVGGKVVYERSRDRSDQDDSRESVLATPKRSEPGRGRV